MTLIGTGQQRLVTMTPLLEDISNLVVSLIAGYLFGAIGVAIGTLVLGIVGVLGNFVYNMKRTVQIEFCIGDYLRDGLLRPLACALPLTAAIVTLSLYDSPVVRGYLLIGTALVSTALLLWRLGLVGSEREKLRSWCILLMQS